MTGAKIAGFDLLGTDGPIAAFIIRLIVHYESVEWKRGEAPGPAVSS